MSLERLKRLCAVCFMLPCRLLLLALNALGGFKLKYFPALNTLGGLKLKYFPALNTLGGLKLKYFRTVKIKRTGWIQTEILLCS